jgi:hypothetical protein
MALTVLKIQGIVARRMHWSLDTWPVDVSIVDLVNDAGECFCALREWAWLERPAVDLDIIASQEYVALPTNCKAVISLETTTIGGLGIFAQPTTMSIVAGKRRAGSWGRAFWYCLATPDESLSGPSPEKRIEIGPVPDENVLAAFQLIYRAGWKRVADSADHVMIPTTYERAFVELVVAHAKIGEKDYAGTLVEHLKPALEYIELLAQDDQLAQTELGPWIGGAGENAAYEDMWPERVERSVS